MEAQRDFSHSTRSLWDFIMIVRLFLVARPQRHQEHLQAQLEVLWCLPSSSPAAAWMGGGLSKLHHNAAPDEAVIISITFSGCLLTATLREGTTHRVS